MTYKTKFKLKPKEVISFTEKEIEFEIQNLGNKIKEIEIVIK